MKFFIAMFVVAFVVLTVAEDIAQAGQLDQPAAPKQKRGVLYDVDYVPYAYAYGSVYPVARSYSALPVVGTYRAGYNHYYHYTY